MMEAEVERSTAKIISLLQHDAKISDALEGTTAFSRRLSPYIEFAEICKHKADDHLCEGDEVASAAFLAQSHALTLRHLAVLKYSKFRHSNPNGKGRLLSALEQLLKKSEQDDLFAFGKNEVTHMNQMLMELPEDWTIAQLSSVPDYQLRFQPSNPASIAMGLYLTVYKGGPKPFQMVMKIPPPPLEVTIIPEFNEILKDHQSVNSGKFKGTRFEYWKHREEQGMRLQSLLGEVQRSWLRFYCCLLLGTMDSRIVKKLALYVCSALEECDITLDTSQTYLLHKLMEASAQLSREDKLQGVAKCLDLPIKHPKTVELLERLEQDLMWLQSLVHEPRSPVILILDKDIQNIPWESTRLIQNQGISRAPSLVFLHALYQIHISTPDSVFNQGVNPDKATYVLNPDGDLPDVEKRLLPFFKQYSTWNGIVHIKPTIKQYEDALEDLDIFIYCGHGSGSKYLPGHLVQKLNCHAVPMLMGCSSGSLKQLGNKTEAHGVVYEYLMGMSPCVVGMLWEVTDRDCDRVTTKILDNWLPGPQQCEKLLTCAVAAGRNGAKQFLTAAAMVCYGLPVKMKS